MACAHPINLCNSLGSGLSDPAPLRWMRQEPWLESAINFPFCKLHCLGGLLSSCLGIWTSGITPTTMKITNFYYARKAMSKAPAELRVNEGHQLLAMQVMHLGQPVQLGYQTTVPHRWHLAIPTWETPSKNWPSKPFLNYWTTKLWARQEGYFFLSFWM